LIPTGILVKGETMDEYNGLVRGEGQSGLDIIRYTDISNPNLTALKVTVCHMLVNVCCKNII